MIVSGRFASILKGAALVLATLVVLFSAIGFYLYRVSLTLPDLATGPESLRTPRTSIVYAADGSVIAKWHGEQDRTVIPLDRMAQTVRDAVVAIEDERFYEHHGVDTKAILRALRSNAEEGQIVQGGSTITQQVVKLLFTGGERNFARKLREAMLAYELEARADKGDVLETYLNTVYFGHGAYGVESAARRYFGVPASDLSLAQSATLAGIIRSPGRYSPIEDPEETLERRNLVLLKMRDLGYISPGVYTEAAATALEVAAPANVPDVAPYFVEYVKQGLIEKLGADAVFQGGLRVYTTLEPAIQAAAESAASQALNYEGDPEYAIVALEHRTGRILAMVGGRDFSKNQFNLAAQGKRQPGSAFKPFVLVRALEEGVRPDQVFDASPYAVEVKDGVWRVNNYENQFAAERLTLRAATNWSVNCVYARLVMQVGAADVAETANRMGITSPLEDNPAIALGGLSSGVSPLEMAAAYGTLASGGLRNDPFAVSRVTDDAGEPVWEPEAISARAVDEAVAIQASLMLHDAVESGTGTSARIPGTWVAGKTGTTQSYRDAWFVGWAEDVSCAVWVGHREGQVPMTKVHGIQVTGGSFPAEIWSRFMAEALSHQRAPIMPGQPAPTSPIEGDGADTDPQAGSPPVLVSVCPDSMQLASKRCPNPVNMQLEPDLVPKNACERH